MFFYIQILVAVAVAAANFDEDEARKLLNLAAGSYGSQQEACLQRTFHDFQKYEIFGPTKAACDEAATICEMYGIVSRKHKRIFVIFRGSRNTLQLLLEALDIFKNSPFLDMGIVNTYFLRAHLVLWPDVVKTLNATEFSSFPVTFIGHSLGGALASLAIAKTVRIGLRNGKTANLMTFGQPRVGNRIYAMKFDQMIPNSFRVVHRQDIVPHLPACDKITLTRSSKLTKPCDLIKTNQRYHHGVEIWYPNGMSSVAAQSNNQHRFVRCDGQPKNEDFNCSDSLNFSLSHIADYIWDHRHYFGIRVPDYGKAGCGRSFSEVH